MKMKALKIFIAAVISLSVFSGCAANQEPKPSEPTTVTDAEKNTDTEPTQKPEEAPPSENEPKRKLIMGTHAEFPPFEFVADNGKGLVDKFDGVDVAIVKKIVDELGMELEIVDMPFDSLILELSTGKIDFIAAGMTIDDERKENVDFTESYYKAIQYIIVPKSDTTINSVKDLEGKIVGVQLGTSGDFFIEDNVKTATINRYNRGMEAVIDLKNGKIDAIVIDSIVAEMFVSTAPDEMKIIKDDENFVIEDYGIAIQKGNTELLDKINPILAKMLESGEIDELVKNYSK